MLLPLLLACRPGPAPGDDTAAAPLVWADCGEGTECATLSRPLRPYGPARLPLHLRRLAPPEPATRVLWYVDGGPGDPGTRLVPALAFFQERFPDLLIVAADQRGTGGSAPLGCPVEEDPASEEGAVVAEGEWPACVASLDPEVLPAFGSLPAADDVAAAVEAASEGLPVVLFGASYGTFLAQRVLERHPDLVAGAILDGLVPPDWTFAELEPAMDETGRRYLALCDADATCAAHLGGDAVAFAQATLAALDDAPCAGLGRAEARALTGALLLGGDDREAIPSVLVKLARCDATDAAALTHLVGTFVGAESEQSEVLLANIGVDELWPAGRTEAEAEAAVADALMATGVGGWMARRAAIWPRWAPPPPSTVTTDRPVLLLHGGLDPTVTLDRLDALLHAWPAGQAVTPPRAGHVTLNFSDCAVAAYVAFLEEPGTPVDDCRRETGREEFDLSAADATRLFGVEEGW